MRSALMRDRFGRPMWLGSDEPRTPICAICRRESVPANGKPCFRCGSKVIRGGFGIAMALGLMPAPTKCGAEVARQREIYVDELPCTCGWPMERHLSHNYERVCPDGNGRTFTHAPTDDLAPEPDTNRGHLYRDYGSGRLYRIARLVRFHSTDGLDYEIEPFRDDPCANDICGKFERKLVSSRAIDRTYHHSRECPCGGGYAR